jgi:hypothetical protein
LHSETFISPHIDSKLISCTLFDVWAINTEDEYAEEGQAKPEIEVRLAPR